MKIANSGLQLKHLKTAYDRNSLDKVMLENVNGKPRVTSTKRIIMALNDFFSEENQYCNHCSGKLAFQVTECSILPYYEWLCSPTAMKLQEA